MICIYIKCIIEMFIRIDFKKILWVFVVCYEYFILIDNYLIIFTHYHFFVLFSVFIIYLCFVVLPFCFCFVCFVFVCFVFLFTFVCVCTLGNPGTDFSWEGSCLLESSHFFLWISRMFAFFLWISPVDKWTFSCG